MRKREDIVVCREDLARQEEFIRSVKELNQGREKKYKLETFGCQMNENDSERLTGMLMTMGYSETDDESESDLILYNTCCVRENAELKVYGHLGGLKKLKRDNPELVIAVCGCMMQQKEVVEHIRKKYRHVDLIFGTHNLHRFPELLYNAVHSGESIVEVWESDGLIAEGVPIERKTGVKAWVTIMYGCNNFCSYCIVPYVRGRERSREPLEIIEEVRLLGKQGYKEVTLLGQNVNSYGKDLGNGINFSELLYQVNEVPGIERIRFMTSHPKDLSGELIRAVKECGKICEHLHLPIQSGSNGILAKMNRRYTREQYLELVSEIRESVPNIALTTDIIAGFPGETDKDFEDTLDILERVRFDAVYTFLYSKRTGTPAAENPDQVAEEDKKRRFDRLVEVQNRISREINDLLPGGIQEVLVEGLSKTSISTMTGRTRTNKIVNFKGNGGLIGKTIHVEITRALTWSLEGKIKK